MSEFWLRIFFENYLEFFPKETQEAVGTSFSYGQWLRKHQLVVMFTQVLHELVFIFMCFFFLDCLDIFRYIFRSSDVQRAALFPDRFLKPAALVVLTQVFRDNTVAATAPCLVNLRRPPALKFSQEMCIITFSYLFWTMLKTAAMAKCSQSHAKNATSLYNQPLFLFPNQVGIDIITVSYLSQFGFIIHCF